MIGGTQKRVHKTAPISGYMGRACVVMRGGSAAKGVEAAFKAAPFRAGSWQALLGSEAEGCNHRALPII